MFDFSEEDKKRFAKAWVANENPFEAALSLFKDDDVEGRLIALKMASFLPKDEETLAFAEEFKNNGDDLKNLPSKGMYARELWNSAQSLNGFPEEKIKFMRLFGETLGYISNKAAVEVNNNNTQSLPPAPTYTIVNE